MAKILVTGGAGFIGSHLCDRLVAQGDEVIVLDNFSSGKRENLGSVQDKIQLIETDTLNILEHADELKGVERIYHLSALISGYDSLNDPDAYVEANITALLRVMELAKQNPGCHIVFASSSTVYGTQPDAEMSEQTPPNPLTMYALSKLSGEHMLAMYAELYGFTYSCARLFNVYGPRQSPTHPYANVTCKFSHAAATDGKVNLYGTGEQSRDFVYVDDVVDALLLLSSPSDHAIYNVGTGADASIRELIDIVSELRGEAMSVTKLPPWPNDIHAIRANTDRIRADFGFDTKRTLKDGLKQTVDFFRTQGE